MKKCDKMSMSGLKIPEYRLTVVVFNLTIRNSTSKSVRIFIYIVLLMLSENLKCFSDKKSKARSNKYKKWWN